LKNAIEAMDEFQGKGKIRIEHYYKNGEIHIKVSWYRSRNIWR